jgi:uncharacterized SAM-binding protein YcdF (DUF218 family)
VARYRRGYYGALSGPIDIAGRATIVCLSAGTVHRPPPLGAEGYPYIESVAGAAYLLHRGIPEDRVQVEASSYDTIGNAYLTKLLHVDPAGWRRLAVVTSEFHMARSRAIFEWIFGLEPGKYSLHFEATPNDGLDGRLLERRIEKEAAALKSLRELATRVRDLPALHRWVHTEHNAYTVRGWAGRRTSQPDIVELY